MLKPAKDVRKNIEALKIKGESKMDELTNLSWDELMERWEEVHESAKYVPDEFVGVVYDAEDEIIDELIERGKNGN